MAMTMHVDIVSAEDQIFSGAVEAVFAPAQMGEVGIMPRHAPMLTPLKTGEVRLKLPVTEGGNEVAYFVSGGLMEVQPHMVTILSDTALRAEDIDEAAARKAKESAEAELKGGNKGIDFAAAQAQLEEALAKLRVIEQMKALKHGKMK